MALESSSNGSGNFRSIFEANMPSSRKPISHDSAAVLLLSYDSTDKAFADLDVQEEIDELGDVFGKEYGFEVDKKVIRSSQSAEAQMNHYLARFVYDYEKEHALLIVYYGGHGSHSDDERRLNPGRFDLHPLQEDRLVYTDTELHRKRTYPKSQREGLIMWEVCENLLRNAKGDLLVIFDSCDTGTLASLRSAGGRAFEYLGACTRGKNTYGPGEHSFTTALTWALRELRSKSPFTTNLLRDKVKEYDQFPDAQKPVLFTRDGYVPEHIWISSRGVPPVTRSTKRQQPSAPEFRDENCDYVDFRVTFHRSLSDKDAKDVASLMGPLVTNQKGPLHARHVSMIGKGTCTPSGNPAARWALLRNHLLAYRRFHQAALAAKQNHLPNRKRKRTNSDMEGGETSLIFQLGSIPSWDVVDETPQLSRLLSSATHESSFEEAVSLGTDARVKAPPAGVKPPATEKKNDPVDRAQPILKDLQALLKDALQHPEVSSSLRLQIREILAEEATEP